MSGHILLYFVFKMSVIDHIFVLLWVISVAVSFKTSCVFCLASNDSTVTSGIGSVPNRFVLHLISPKIYIKKAIYEL